MRTKKLAIVWLLLGGFAAVSQYMLTVQMDEGIVAVRKKFAAPKITDEQALAQAYAACEEDYKHQLELATSGGSCKSVYEDSSSEVVEMAQMSSRWRHNNREIKPRIDDLVQRRNEHEEIVLGLFGVASAVILLLWV